MFSFTVKAGCRSQPLGDHKHATYSGHISISQCLMNETKTLIFFYAYTYINISLIFRFAHPLGQTIVFSVGCSKLPRVVRRDTQGSEFTDQNSCAGAPRATSFSPPDHSVQPSGNQRTPKRSKHSGSEPATWRSRTSHIFTWSTICLCQCRKGTEDLPETNADASRAQRLRGDHPNVCERTLTATRGNCTLDKHSAWFYAKNTRVVERKKSDRRGVRNIDSRASRDQLRCLSFNRFSNTVELEPGDILRVCSWTHGSVNF